jgi:hypothetical protein
MNIKDHVKGNSNFTFYRAGNLWYVTDIGLEFPIPISDTDGATFPSEMKSLTLMRWIRKHLSMLAESTNLQARNEI